MAHKSAKASKTRPFSLTSLFVIWISFFVGFSSSPSASDRGGKPSSSQSGKTESKIVAEVGDSIITAADLDEAVEKYVPRGGFHVTVDVSQKEKYRKDALNDLIEIELLHKESLRRKIQVSDEDLDKIEEENVKRFGSKKKLEDALNKMNLTMKTFREKIRKHQKVIRLLNSIAKETEPSEKELREYYDKNRETFKRPEAMRVYHLLVKVEPTASEAEWAEKKEAAEDLRRRIEQGESFSDVAYKYSEDPYKVKGGDMGIIHRGMLEPVELDDAAFSLKEGELSEVIKTLYGYHIVKAGEKKPAATLSFDEVKDRLKKELHEKRFLSAKEDLLRSLGKELPVIVHIKTDEKE